MPTRVHPADDARNPEPLSDRQIRLMAIGLAALQAGRLPDLTDDEMVEAGELLEALPGPEDDGPHSDDCPCWLHDDEPAYHEDERYDMAVDLGALRGRL